MWSPQTEFFKDNFRVIAPALPGFGKSQAIQSCDSIYCMAKSILDILELKKIDNFNLLGHSMGGMVVQEMAKLAPEKIAKLICYGTGPRGDIPGRFETIDQSREKLKINGLESTAYKIAKTWFIEGDKAKYFYLCEEAGKQTSMQAADNGLIAMKNWNGVKNLNNIKNDTLIVWGEEDKAYNYNQVKTLKDNIPNSTMKIIGECSHNAHLEKPLEFNSYVKDFLENK
jgi:pimeloyl-ACP methyl ester carboxylesterase